MAGGSGLRMGGGEKPIQPLCGKPMIAYVIDALLKSERIGRIHIAVSPKVPGTQDFILREYANNKKIGIVMTPGAGYISDTVSAVDVLALRKPFLIVAADLPLVSASVVDLVVDAYGHCGKEALSVRLPAEMIEKPDLVLSDTGSDTVPAGINILNGAHMDRAQDEYALIVEDPALAVNVNYRADLERCAELLRKITQA
jgi:adenosylcobinamide-phosphate guanylyltransferase